MVDVGLAEALQHQSIVLTSPVILVLRAMMFPPMYRINKRHAQAEGFIRCWADSRVTNAKEDSTISKKALKVSSRHPGYPVDSRWLGDIGWDVVSLHLRNECDVVFAPESGIELGSDILVCPVEDIVFMIEVVEFFGKNEGLPGPVLERYWLHALACLFDAIAKVIVVFPAERQWPRGVILWGVSEWAAQGTRFVVPKVCVEDFPMGRALHSNQ